MNPSITRIISAILGTEQTVSVEIRKVRFEELPAACANEYRPGMRGNCGAEHVEIMNFDLDGDGRDEMLVCSGSAGSCGGSWSVMTPSPNGWTCAGRVSGELSFVSRLDCRGLLACLPLGGNEARWDFYELRKGVLHNPVSASVQYARSGNDILRSRPVKIEVKTGK